MSSGGGKGGGKGGGGGNKQPTQDWKAGTTWTGGNVETLLGGEQNLSNYVSSLFPTAVSMGNYAADYATGGAALPASGPYNYSFLDPGNEYFGLSSTIENPGGTPYYPGLPSVGTDSNVNTTGSGQSIDSGGQMMGSVQGPASGGSAAPSTPGATGGGGGGAQQWYDYTATSPSTQTMLSPGEPYSQTSNQAGSQLPGRYNPSTGQSEVLVNGQWMDASKLGPWAQISQNQAQTYQQMAKQAGSSPAVGSSGAQQAGQRAATQSESLINQELAGINAERSIASTPAPGLDPATISGIESDAFSNEAAMNAQANSLDAQGLFPDQEALVDTQTKAAQSAVETQLSNEGLGSSTQAAELAGELGQQGAAEKGQLIQGNIQLAQNAVSLAQNWAKLGMGEQALSEGAKTDVFNMFSTISQQYGQAQAQMWQEALSGYGLLNSFVNDLVGVYGLSSQTFGQMFGLLQTQEQAQAGIEEASLQAQQGNSSSMMSGLASIAGALIMAFA